MLNRRTFHYLLLLLIFVLGGCRSRSHIVNLQNQWSGLDPQSIPLSIRNKEYDKGNLVSNPSFEMGRYYYVDTVKLSFNLPGWKKLGEDVYWTDTQNKSGFEPDEASSGIHAIRIERNTSDETDVQGEGIISDYIRVIPGNYRLSMDVRLKNVESGLDRLGTNIYDAINIMLYFYDRNKVLIRNQAYHPANNNMIDNSFKGQPFSNFRYINEFGWGRFIARSGNFPFEEGNLPDDARYVRIFAGLKGTGMMWIDMVDFRYSPENYTFLEKIRPLFDSTLERSGYVMPQPQKTGKPEKIDLVRRDDHDKDLKPVILIPSNANASFKKIIEGFINELKRAKLYSKNENPVITRITSPVLESGRLLLNFGNTSLTNQFSDHLPLEEIINKSQAYYIRHLDVLENVIFIGSTDDQGLQHAVNTLLQLIDVPGKIYHHYDITDYPDFTLRGVIIPSGDAALKTLKGDRDLSFLMDAGFNRFILEPREDQVSSTEVFDKSRADFRKIVALKKQKGYISAGISLREMKFPLLSQLRSNNENLASEKYLEAAAKEADNTASTLAKFRAEGADIVIQFDMNLWNCMDFGTMHKSIIMLHDKPFQRFMGIRDAYWKGLENNPKLDTGMTVCLYPLFPDNRLMNQVEPEGFCYYRSLEKFSDVYSKQLWTGPVTYSTIIDDVDFARFTSESMLPVLFFDNTLTGRKEDLVMGGYSSKYPGKAATGVMFEPYGVELAPDIRTLVKNECIMNVGDLDELTLIRLATAADYLWNNTGYDPWLSTWKILLSRYGRETGEELVYFNDLYYNLLAVCLKLENEGYNPKLLKTGDEIVVQLDAHWGNLKVMLQKNVDFLDDLSDLKNHVISRFFKAKKVPESLRK